MTATPSMRTPAPLRTTVVGSYPQPDWLIDREGLKAGIVPRTKRSDLWRIEEPHLAAAIQDATLLAIRDMEATGVDIVTDGEIGRESYSNHFAGTLDGLDTTNPARIVSRRGRETLVPRVVGPIIRARRAEASPAAYLRAATDRLTKVTLPGPFTLAQQAQDEHYGDTAELAWAFAVAINEEALELEAAGIDIIQIDEPWVRNDPEAARRFAVQVIDRAFLGITAWKAIHLCFGYGFLVKGEKPRSYEFLTELADSEVDEIVLEAAQPQLDLGVLRDLAGKSVALGVVDLSSETIDSVEVMGSRLREALRYISPNKLLAAPDCGMKYMSRAAASQKLAAMIAAARSVRDSL